MYNASVKSFPLSILLIAAVPISFSFLPTRPSSTAALQGLQVNRIILFRAIPYEVRPGGVLTLEGSGFSKTLNKVYFNGAEAINASSTNGLALKVAIPTTLYSGEYELSVSNVFGSSENRDRPIKIKVTETPEDPPVIASASLSNGLVTLVGTGFSSSNSVLTTMGNSPSPIAASGNTLTFRLSELSMYSQIISKAPSGKYQITLWIHVQNEHGMTISPYRLALRL